MKETIEQIQKDRINILNKTIDILSRINKRDEEQINILKHNIDNRKQNTNHIDAIIINKDYQIHQKVLHIESLQHTIEIDKQNTFNILVNQLKGERDFNPKMNMTDAQINDLAQDVKDSNNCE
tara:strand:- start:144 stop:512 length:369 start_codon:yes stop_codon:yes gene_type:complete